MKSTVKNNTIPCHPYIIILYCWMFFSHCCDAFLKQTWWGRGGRIVGIIKIPIGFLSWLGTCFLNSQQRYFFNCILCKIDTYTIYEFLAKTYREFSFFSSKNEILHQRTYDQYTILILYKNFDKKSWFIKYFFIFIT